MFLLSSLSSVITLEDNNSSTVVEAFELATERRAREWQEYELLTGEKEALRAQIEAEQRREEEQKEKEEIARLRQEQVTAKQISLVTSSSGSQSVGWGPLMGCKGTVRGHSNRSSV